MNKKALNEILNSEILEESKKIEHEGQVCFPLIYITPMNVTNVELMYFDKDLLSGELAVMTRKELDQYEKYNFRVCKDLNCSVYHPYKLGFSEMREYKKLDKKFIKLCELQENRIKEKHNQNDKEESF